MPAVLVVLSGEFKKDTMNTLGSLLLTVANLAAAAAMPLQPHKELQDEHAGVLWSQFEKKVIYQNKESSLPQNNDVLLVSNTHRAEGRRRNHLPSPAALTQCEHANGLTSTTTSGLHTHTHTHRTNTHRVHLTPQQIAPISVILTTASR